MLNITKHTPAYKISSNENILTFFNILYANGLNWYGIPFNQIVNKMEQWKGKKVIYLDKNKSLYIGGEADYNYIKKYRNILYLNSPQHFVDFIKPVAKVHKMLGEAVLADDADDYDEEDVDGN